MPPTGAGTSRHLSTIVKCWVIVLMGMVYVVTAAPLASSNPQQETLFLSTSTEGVMTTTEELDFKDVPIYPKEKPGSGTPVVVAPPPSPPVKYVQVLKCDTNDKGITVTAVDNQLQGDTGDSSSTAEKTQSDTAHTAEVDAIVPAKNKDPEAETAAVPLKMEEDSQIQQSAGELPSTKLSSDSQTVDYKKTEDVVKILENVKAAVAEVAEEQQNTRPEEEDKINETQTAEKIAPSPAVAVANELKQDSAVQPSLNDDDIKLKDQNDPSKGSSTVETGAVAVAAPGDNRGIAIVPFVEESKPLSGDIIPVVESENKPISSGDLILPVVIKEIKPVDPAGSEQGEMKPIVDVVVPVAEENKKNDDPSPMAQETAEPVASVNEEAVKDVDTKGPEAENSTIQIKDESDSNNNKNEEFESGSEMMAANEEPIKDFTGYKVYRVTIPTEEAAAWILKFEDLPGVEFWADPKLLLRPRGFFVTSAADLLVAPDVTTYIEEAFQQARLPFEILINDLQNAIKNENPPEPLNVQELTNRNGHSMTWDRYHSLEDIYSYLDYLNTTFPRFVTVSEIGKSTEGRPIKAIRLSQKGGRANKKTIFIDSGIHAREWITHATSTYMIREIVEDPVKYDCLMNEFDFVFVPVINPDGYVYSHTHNRMWRKTRSQSDNIVFRQTAQESLNAERLARFDQDPILDDSILEQLRSKVINNKASFSCTGTDANRNWDFKWLTGGSSKNPCTDTYAGSKAFSEPETRALSNYILSQKDDIEMYISLHAYSQFWLLPWGFTQTKPDDYTDLYSLAKIGSQALEKVNGIDYMIGTIPDLLYVASGSSIDWVKGVAGVKYAYTLELRDVGRYGFVLPADKIIPSGIETWAGVYASAVELANRVYSDSAQCPAL